MMICLFANEKLTHSLVEADVFGTFERLFSSLRIITQPLWGRWRRVGFRTCTWKLILKKSLRLSKATLTASDFSRGLAIQHVTVSSAQHGDNLGSSALLACSQTNRSGTSQTSQNLVFWVCCTFLGSLPVEYISKLEILSPSWIQYAKAMKSNSSISRIIRWKM